MGVNQLSGSSRGGKITTLTGSSQGGARITANNNDLSFLKGKIDDAMSGSGSSTGSGSGSGTGSLAGGTGLSGEGYETSSYGYGGGGGGIDINALIAQQRAAAENAYGNSMNRLENAWNANQRSLQNNLQSTLDRLKSQYDYSSGVVNEDANKSLREAYINYMLNKKNLAQGLSAMGMSGGATESSLAKMYNNYGSSRNNINTTLADNLAGLLNEYQGNVSNANQLYNSQYADAMNQYTSQMNGLEQALASALTNLYTGSNLSGYASYINALGNMPTSFSNGSYATNLANINNTGEYTPTENTLGLTSVNTTASNNMGSVTDYAKWKAMADSLAQNGATAQDIIYQLKQNGLPLDQVLNVLGA